MTDCAGLTGDSAAADAADNIELLSCACECERLTDDELEGLKTEIVINVSIIDYDFACTGIKTNSGNRLFSAACTVKIRN